MFGVPREHFAIGYVRNDNLPLGNIALQMSFQTIAGKSDSVFWWFHALSEEFFSFKFTKTVLWL